MPDRLRTRLTTQGDFSNGSLGGKYAPTPGQITRMGLGGLVRLVSIPVTRNTAGNIVLDATQATITITGGGATLEFVGTSENANSWFNGSWWPSPTFGTPTTWFESTALFVLTVDAGAVTITGGDATLSEPLVIELVATEGSITITGGSATTLAFEPPLDATAASIVITGGLATLQIEYSSEEFLLSKVGTFDNLNIDFNEDVAYNTSTDIGYKILARVDIDTMFLDGIFGVPPQPYKIQKYLTETTVPAMITVEFNGTEWVVVSKTTLGL